jgi:hypothetical protein
LVNLNTYASVSQPQVQKTITLVDWLNKIKTSEFSTQITEARKYTKGDVFYDETKASLPCVTYNFLYNKYKKDINIIGSTGIIYIDVDEPSFCISYLNKEKAYAYYKSFGGKGYSILVLADGITKKNFKHNYQKICEELGIANYVDLSARKASQFNIISYDENIFINDTPFIFDAIEVATPTSVIKKEQNIYTSEGGKIRFNNLDEVELDGNDYTVYWDGIEYVNCFIPMKKREAGNRNSFLLSYANNLIWLNPNLSKENLGTILLKVNSVACNPPVPENKIATVVESIFKYKESGSLEPISFWKKRKFVFDPNKQLTKKEKWEIMIAEMSDKKMNDSQQKLYVILEGWDVDRDGKITQRGVYNNHPISKKTVEKYWPLFKEYVADLNSSSIRIEDKPSAVEKVVDIEENKAPITLEDMIKRLEKVDRYSDKYIGKRSMIAYVLDKHESLGLDGIAHFYNEIFNYTVA